MTTLQPAPAQTARVEITGNIIVHHPAAIADRAKSCPTRLMDGRNEIRCWLDAGHEGGCK